MKSWINFLVIIGLVFPITPSQASIVSCDWVAGYEKGVDATVLVASATDLPCGPYRVSFGGFNLGLEFKAGSTLIVSCTADDPSGTYYGFPVLSLVSATALVGLRLSFGFAGSNGYCTLGGFGVGGAGATVGIVPILYIKHR